MRRLNGQHKGLLTGAHGVPRISEDTKPDVDRKLAEEGKDVPVVSDNVPGPDTTDTDLALDIYPPWDIKSIQECFGGRYDRETIVDMLQKCRGDIDRAFAALLDEKTDVPFDKKVAPGLPIKPSLQASRSSSPFSTGSKRSAEDSDDSEDPRPARRTRPKRRIVSNLTLGVGISFRDDQNELVSLNLRVSIHTYSAQS